MSSGWRTSAREDRGAYMTVAQAENGNAEVDAHGDEHDLL